MLLVLLTYLGGVLTIVSPCILPVLPFVFARAGQPFARNGLPMLVGMAGTFSLAATLAAVGGGWAVDASQYGRMAALAILALFGLALLSPALSARLSRPVVALGARLSQSAERSGPAFIPSLLLGIATGLLWAPCAGPILGLILTGAALQGPSVGTSLLLFAYAAGAATSLGLAVLAGGRVFEAMKRSLGAGEWVRRGLGGAVLAAVCAIAFGLDTGFLTRLSLSSTSSIEQRLLDGFRALPQQPASSVAMTGGPTMMMSPAAGRGPVALDVEGEMPSLAGAVQWLNSPPLTNATLRGKVVVIDFWTYSCINCLRAIPYVRAWADKYRSAGLVVIGVHTPEFAFEKNLGNVKRAVSDLQIDYPVAIDNDYAVWRAFNNRYWPAHYFVDARGRVRHHRFGEGHYDESERVIQRLLDEAGATELPRALVSVNASGRQAAAAQQDVFSPETYLGYQRAERFVSPGGATQDRRAAYTPGKPRLNEWGFSGDWTISREHATLDARDGSIVYRFHARDLHLVLGPAADGKPVRFLVTLDGEAPGEHQGVDVEATGRGVVTEHRLYQLIRQNGPVIDRTFEIRFLDPGVQAYAFTFG